MPSAKATITLDEEANQPHEHEVVVAPPFSTKKKMAILVAIALFAFFGAGLLAGTYSIDTSDDLAVGWLPGAHSIPVAETPRDVYSINPVSIVDQGAAVRMAIGDPVYSESSDQPGDSTEDRRGRVRIFELHGRSWQPVGQTLIGLTEIAAFGYSVELSPDGSILAVGMRNDNDSTTRNGAVYIYIYDEQDKEWKFFGNAAKDASSVDYAACGNTVSLAGDSTTVAYMCSDEAYVSTFSNDAYVVEKIIAEQWSTRDVKLSLDGQTVLLRNGLDDARIMDRIDNEWVVRGDTAEYETLASALADDTVQLPQTTYYDMSKDGVILSVLYSTLQNEALIRTFQFNGQVWKQFGTDIILPEATDEFTMSLSDDGRKLVASLEMESYSFEYRDGSWVELNLWLRNKLESLDLSSNGSMLACQHGEGADRAVHTLHHAFQ